jgi:hypothetical protein
MRRPEPPWLARAALCAFASALAACHPEDANVGGDFQCPEGAEAACFFYDRGLHAQSLTEQAKLRALFDVEADADLAKAPSIAYPLADTIEPRNLYDLDIQWRRPRLEQTLFRIRIQSPKLPYGRYDLYTQCFPANGGCHYGVPDNEPNLEWATHVVTPLVGAEAVLTVAASDGKGGPIAVSAPVHLRFSWALVPGGLYYWSAHPPNAPPGSPDQGTTYRLALGARSAAPFIRPGQENPNKCEGCHAVSGNGSKIAFTATDDLDPEGTIKSEQAGSFISKDTTNPSGPPDVPAADKDSAMIALDYQGKLALVGHMGELELRTLGSGEKQAIDGALLGAEGHGYFPEFSPDSRHIVVTLSDHPDSPWAVTTGSIATLDFDPSTQRFLPAQVLVPMTEQEFYFYPSWSPDNQWIVFAAAPRGLDLSRCLALGDPMLASCTGCVCDGVRCCPPNRSYDQPNARLKLAHFPDGRVYDLARATQGVGLSSTLPKFAPLPSDGHQQLFITFNSKMPYGVEVPKDSPAQLWLSVLDLDRLPDDPSGAPVWLPFQNFGQKNHLAYWTDHVACRADLITDQGCGPDENCRDGECVPNTIVK